MLYKRLIINGTEYKLAVDQSGSGVPTAHTQGAVGVLYMDTDDSSLYKCTGVADGKYTWVLVETGGSGKDGGYYTPEVTQPDSKTMEIAFAPSKAGMPAVTPVQVELPVPDSVQDAPEITLDNVYDVTHGSGVRVTVKKDEHNAESATIWNGQDGNSAYASVSKNDNGTIVITTKDATGTRIVEIPNNTQSVNIYIGPDRPTDGTRYWLDTSESGSSDDDTGGETEPVTYNVTAELTNVTIDNTAESVNEGESYAATLTADSGYVLSVAIVTMGGVDITNTAYSGGNIYISSVTGNVVIAATAVESAAGSYAITNNLTNATSNNSAVSVEKNGSYTATITAADGYRLDIATVYITMGGVDVTSEVYSGGVISIPAVTGDVVITVSAGKSGVYNLADVSTETLENRAANSDTTERAGYTRYKIENIKAGNIVTVYSTNADSFAAWYDGTNYYAFKDTTKFTKTMKENYAYYSYTWVADADYDMLYFASKTSLIDSHPGAVPTIEKAVI